MQKNEYICKLENSQYRAVIRFQGVGKKMLKERRKLIYYLDNNNIIYHMSPNVKSNQKSKIKNIKFPWHYHDPNEIWSFVFMFDNKEDLMYFKLLVE